MSDQTHYETCWKDPRHHECALRRIAELEARWIPVEERLPEDDQSVLVWFPDEPGYPGIVEVASYEDHHWIGVFAPPTHWMPLPEPPEVKP